MDIHVKQAWFPDSTHILNWCQGTTSHVNRYHCPQKWLVDYLEDCNIYRELFPWFPTVPVALVHVLDRVNLVLDLLKVTVNMFFDFLKLGTECHSSLLQHVITKQCDGQMNEDVVNVCQSVYAGVATAIGYIRVYMWLNIRTFHNDSNTYRTFGWGWGWRRISVTRAYTCISR